ncbi:MAG: hypothetical protein IJY09_04450 [Lachnospiraceae bacterium]|nr:hypothetical protein [Lachnospiraceae bacterium]
MKKKVLYRVLSIGILCGAGLLTGCGKEPADEAGEASAPSVTEAAVPTEEITKEPEITPTAVPTPEIMPSLTPTPEPVATPTAVPTPTKMPEDTQAPTPTAKPSPMPTAIPTPIAAQVHLTEEQAQFAEQLKQQTADELMWIVCKDYDLNGAKEAFAVTGRVDKSPFLGDGQASTVEDCYFGDVWFLTETSTECLLEEVYIEPLRSLALYSGKSLQVVEVLQEKNTRSYLYRVDKAEVNNLLPEHVAGFQKAEDPFGNHANWFEGYEWAYDRYSDGTGFTRNPHYFSYGEELEEQAGISVTKEQLYRWESGQQMIDEIEAAGGVVGAIYYFANIDSVCYAVNYQLPVEGQPGLWENCHVLAQIDDQNAEFGDDGPEWLTSDLEHADWDYTLAECGRPGTYSPVLCPAYAQYPNYIPDTEYSYFWDYQLYGKPTNDSLKVKTADGTLVFDGGDIATVSETNLLFTFNEVFLEEAKQRYQELGAKAGENEVQRMLGLSSEVTSLQLWYKDECLMEAPILDYMGEANSGITVQSMSNEDLPTTNYEGKLVWMLDENQLAAEETVHAFARIKNKLDETDCEESPGIGKLHLTEQEYLVDLNGDGVKETIFVGGRKFLVNAVDYFALMEDVWNDNMEKCYYTLLDLDESDGMIEIVLCAYGPSADEWAKVFWYDGRNLQVAGALPGSAGLWSDEEWIGDGNGRVSVICGLDILQTWSARKTYELTAEHRLELAEAEEYAVLHWSNELPEYQLLQAIRLYETRDAKGSYQVLQPQTIRLLATDEEHFVLVEAEDGNRGYMYIENYDDIQLEDGSTAENGYEVIEGLHYAG